MTCVTHQPLLRGRADLFSRSAPEVLDRGGFPFGLEPGAVADQVGEDGDGAGVFEGGEPFGVGVAAVNVTDFILAP